MQQKIYKAQKEKALLNIEDFHKLIIKEAPHLYHHIYNAVVDPHASKIRMKQQEKRVLVIINLLIFYRREIMYRNAILKMHPQARNGSFCIFTLQMYAL